MTQDERTIPHPTPITGFNDQASIGSDPSPYMKFLEDRALSQSEKEELLAALWNIINQFVQMGFGVHPFQQAGPDSHDCGQTEQESGFSSSDMLRSIRDEKESPYLLPRFQHETADRRQRPRQSGTSLPTIREASWL
ncbi:MAG: hypothetical protein AAFR74_07220 [Pseudomonadota bacterium]